MNIKFGTDGWRAVIAEDFNFANVARVAQAAADYWKSEVRSQKSEIFGRELKVVVGFDRRFFSDRFAQTTAEILAGNGFQVVLTPEPTPTPSVSFAVKSLNAVGGVMITASHNPPIFNGFKLKSFYGGSSDPENLQGRRKFSRPQSVPSNRPSTHRRIGKFPSGRPPGAFRRAETARGFQVDCEIKTAFRPRRFVWCRRRLLRTVAGGHDLQGHDAQCGA